MTFWHQFLRKYVVICVMFKFQYKQKLDFSQSGLLQFLYYKVIAFIYVLLLILLWQDEQRKLSGEFLG